MWTWRFICSFEQGRAIIRGFSFVPLGFVPLGLGPEIMEYDP